MYGFAIINVKYKLINLTANCVQTTNVSETHRERNARYQLLQFSDKVETRLR